MRLTVNVDGGARGNPGPAAVGVVVRDADGEILVEHAERIGRTTNNVAEYRALLLGIATAREIGGTELDLVGDSELIVRQVEGRYKVKDATLRELHAEATRQLG
ncbi:MAG: ribonuclease HI family protein, partial [Solirubrobacterales bacterium]